MQILDFCSVVKMRLKIDFILLFVALFASLCVGHMGHDHDGDHSSHSDGIPETDPKWTSSSIHALPLTGVDLKWMVDSEDPKSVVMKMSSKTGGYVSVGFCAVWVGTMEGCDIVLGWVDGQGTAHVHDYYASGNMRPTLDEKQDVQLVSGKEEQGITTIIFKRKWDTGDDNKDANLEHNHVHVIYAWHPEDPSSPSDFHKHEVGTRGHTNKPIPFMDHDHGQGSSGTSLLPTFTFLSIATVCASFWYLIFRDY